MRAVVVHEFGPVESHGLEEFPDPVPKDDEVLIDGAAVRACLMLAVQAGGRTIDTVEGLASDETLSPLQAAFHRNFALQCGFCTPGFLMSLTEVLERNPDPSEDEVRDALSGNLCRCTGYKEIVDAALEAAAELRGDRIPLEG